MGDHQRRLTWQDRVLEDVRQLADVMPAAAFEMVEAMERMAAAGFNYGRATSAEGGWYLPTGKLGVFYSDHQRVLEVVRVVDARRLRELP
ncbi:MAG: hypothetical protein ACR2GX_05165 [Candidatus Dormibacteria bacterium]